MVDRGARDGLTSERSSETGPFPPGLETAEVVEPPSDREPAHMRRWVRIAVGGRDWAVPLERVREILTPQPFTRLPGCDAHVAGLVGVRGRVVTVLDLGRILGSCAAASRSDHRLLLVDHGDRVVGLAVDDASAVMDGALRPPVPEPERLAGVDFESPDTIGFVRAENGGFLALDIDAVIGRHIV